MTSHLPLTLTFVVCVLLTAVTSQVYQVTVTLNQSQFSTDRQFVSFMTGSNLFKRKDKFNCDFSTARMRTLGAAVSPATMRVGGSAADHLIFDHTNSAPRSALEPSQFYLTGAKWQRYTEYCRAVSFDLMYNLNLFHWVNDSLKHTWDPTNARQFLDYSQDHNIHIPYFQLGNEVNAYPWVYGFRVTPADLTRHFHDLRALLAEYPLYSDSLLVGPDVTKLRVHGSARQYLIGFMQAGGNDAVDVIGLHHYYCNGRTARVREFLSTVKMTHMKTLADQFDVIVRPTDPDIPVWLSETSSCYGGGARGLSNSYVAGFLWLDKLGVSAARGISRLMRTLFCGPAAYSLIDHRGHIPYPDYYLTVLYKRLVLGPVLHVTSQPTHSRLRLYAHCARQDFYNYPAGAIVIYYLNTNNRSMTLNLAQFSNHDLELFMLTPTNSSDITSKRVDLNGVTLEMTSDHALPDMTSAPHRGRIEVTRHSFGFFVVPGASVSLCMVASPGPSVTTM